MEPQLPSPSHSPENGPAHFQGGETFLGSTQPEQAPRQPERQESREQHVGGPAGDPAAVQAAAPALPPLPVVVSVPAPAQQVADSSNPAGAADEDLIEKEWVEKAKKVVADTKHDPYLQGQEVSKLQADYLKKRYGKVVSMPADEA
jgi:hypothetical protein